MNTSPSTRSGYALGTVMVLALIMLAAVGSLIAYATNEYRSAHRNQLATEAFHLAEQGIELGIDALASDAHKAAGSGWTNPSASRYKRTTATPGSTLAIYIDDNGGNVFTVRARAEIERSDTMAAARAIRTRFTYHPGQGTKQTPGPAIGGNSINLNFNGAANNEGEANRYACFKSRYGKPVWNPREFYPQTGPGARPELWTTDDDGNYFTNCFDGFNVTAIGNSTSDCNIGAARIYGHVVTPAAGVVFAYETTAPDKPAAWLGEARVATDTLANDEKPYDGWVELPDQPGYAAQQTYGNANTLIDGKCIEHGVTNLDTSWFDVPAQPTIDAAGTITDAGGANIPAGTVPTRLGNPNGPNIDYVNYNGGGTVTWPASGESAAVYRAENFDINRSTDFVINGPVTLIVTGTKCGFAGGSIKFGPNGSLTVFYSGQHATLDKVLSQNYSPARQQDGTIDIPANQGSALAAAADCFDPKKLRFNCTNPNGGDFVIHTSDTNKQVAAEIIAPHMTVRLHAASSRSTFIGRLLGDKVETTNSFDFFYDLDNGGDDDDGETRNWVMSNWQQVLPSSVSDVMPPT